MENTRGMGWARVAECETSKRFHDGLRDGLPKALSGFEYFVSGRIVVENELVRNVIMPS